MHKNNHYLTIGVAIIFFISGVFYGSKFMFKNTRISIRNPVIKQKKVNDNKYLDFIYKLNPNLSVYQVKLIFKTIILQSKIYGINFKIPFFIIAEESRFNPYIQDYSYGLMQINPRIWNSELRQDNIIKRYRNYFQIVPNIKSGIFILKKYQDLCEYYEKDHILGKMGYNNVTDCTILHYYGNVHSKFYLHRWYKFYGEFKYNN
jgi:hypothetical protein